MKAWHISKRGTPQDVKWGDVAGSPKGDLTYSKVWVLGASLNPADQKVLKGKDGGKFLHSNRFPIQLGYDFSGKTESGEEVYGFLPYSTSNTQGTFSEWIFAREGEIAKKPANLDHSEAASLPTAALTALQALRDQAGLKKGGRVLINGASGGVGSLAVQIAKILGASVTATASKEKLEFVKSLGADEAVDYRATRLEDIGSIFDAVLDVAANSSFSVCRRLLKSGGSYVTLLPSPALLLGFAQSLLTEKRARFVMVKSTRRDLEQITRWVEAGLLRPCVERRFAIADLPQALELLASGKAKGKITLSTER